MHFSNALYQKAFTELCNPKPDGCPGATCRARVTLTFGVAKQMFQMAHLLMMEYNCANLY